MGRLWACTHFNSESRHAASSLKSSLKRAPVVHGSRVQVYFGPSGSSNLAGPHPQSASIVVDLSHALPSPLWLDSWRDTWANTGSQLCPNLGPKLHRRGPNLGRISTELRRCSVTRCQAKADVGQSAPEIRPIGPWSV